MQGEDKYGISLLLGLLLGLLKALPTIQKPFYRHRVDQVEITLVGDLIPPLRKMQSDGKSLPSKHKRLVNAF